MTASSRMHRRRRAAGLCARCAVPSANYLCPSCREKKLRGDTKWRAARVEENRAYHRAWRAKNPEKLRAHRLVKNSKQPERRARKLYGKSLEFLAALLKGQGGRCCICGVVLVSTRKGTRATVRRNCAVTDHYDSADGPVVRGILCSACNMAIGLLGDRPETLRAAADYLEKRGHR